MYALLALSVVFASLNSAVLHKSKISGRGAVVFFPAFNGGVTLLSACLGVVLLREKLSKRQIFGILVGVCGICIVGIF